MTHDLSPLLAAREPDALAATGEQVSAALLVLPSASRGPGNIGAPQERYRIVAVYVVECPPLEVRYP
ncbi:MAG: hypothetical protein RMJ98_08720 [Myxococcales bacterium]|nr:hypothetical protein [Polyangiaceae bacterium]MDW8249371.1 hypothetical protein [Myxococcales bacterium]